MRHDRPLEPVAEIRRVRGEDAIPEAAEDGLVLLAQLALEVCLVLVEIVEVGHPASV